MTPLRLLSRDANLVRVLLGRSRAGATMLGLREGLIRFLEEHPRLRLRCVSCFERWGTALPDHHDHARSSPGRRFCNRRRCVFSLLSPFPRDQSRENDVESRQWTGRPPGTGLTAEPDSATPDG